jgi:serine/threonine protein kinase/Tfp pilus assembly protein PilF
MNEPGSATVLCAEQRQRWQQGEPLLVESYLERQPALRGRPEAVLDLIYNEIVLREERGDRPRLEEYLERFPQFASQLPRQFEVHQAIEGGPHWGLLTAATVLEPAPPPAPAAVLPEGAALPGYEILGELGRGGMGIVYKARQRSLKRLVALKMILAGARASAQDRSRFRIEAEAVARLQHANIVQIHEIGEHEGLPYFSLELVDGPSLEQIIGGRPQPPTEAARMVQTLARAIAHAHQQGIIHRDLKPSNILLERGEGRGARDEKEADSSSPLAPRPSSLVPKITDFGLAKLLDTGAGGTRTKEFLGTPSYVAPEQAAGRAREVGPAADVYSLGAILYELLTGQPPFLGDTPLATLERVCRQEPVPPRRLRPDVTRDLETICLKCLEKEPGRRYASAMDLADDLGRFLAGEPIRSRPAGPVERLRKWARRRPATAAVLAVSSAALMALGLFFLWHERDVRDRQEQSLGREKESRAQYQQFVQWLDEAVFYGMYGTLLTDADVASNLEATRAAARAALALAGIVPGADAPPVDSSPLWEHQRAAVRAGCYQLLLVLAEVEAYPQPGQPLEARRRQLRQALDLLAEARRLTPPGPAYHLRRARYLEQLGEQAGAQAERAQAATLKPAGAIDYFLLGDEHAKQGAFAKARRAFEHALRLQRDDFWSHFFLALCRLQSGRPDDAQDSLAECAACLAQRPRFIWAHLLQAIAHERQKDPAAAEAAFQRALTLDPNPHARFVLYANRGRLRLEHGQLDGASADLQQALALQPRHPFALLTLARVCQTQGRLEKSQELLAQALRQQLPARAAAECHVEQARNLYLAKRYHDVLKACAAAETALPGCADSHYLRAQALVQMKELAEAVKAFDAYLAKGGKATADFFRGRGAARFQAKDYLGARDDYTRVIEQAPGSDIYAHRGWAYYFADAWQPALADFEEAVRRDPNNADAAIGRGLARVMLGSHRQAADDAARAMRLKPQAPEMMHNVACIFALAVARVESDPAEEMRQGLAAAYRQRALQALRRTLALVPAPERVRFWYEKVVPDSALDAIRNSDEFKELDRELVRPSKILPRFLSGRAGDYDN